MTTATLKPETVSFESLRETVENAKATGSILVDATSSKRPYHKVVLVDGRPVACSCEHFTFRNVDSCKHMDGVQILVTAVEMLPVKSR